MAEYRVELVGKAREVYYVEAESPEEAEENWFDGEFSHQSDAWDFEVDSVELIEEED